MPESQNYFQLLNSVDVSDKTEKKNGLTYLSWAWAWAEVKKRFPDATYTIYENAEGLNYHHDGKTCWVKTGVTVNGIECIEYLPVMDFRNQSIPKDKVTSFEVNKAIQRSLTKAIARHGLGLYVYAGEDLPEDAPQNTAVKLNEKTSKPSQPSPPIPASPKSENPSDAPETPVSVQWVCADCGRGLMPYMHKGEPISIRQHAALSEKKFGAVLCRDCIKKRKGE